MNFSKDYLEKLSVNDKFGYNRLIKMSSEKNIQKKSFFPDPDYL